VAVFSNPAFEAFFAQPGEELTLAQVLIRRAKKRFEMRHVGDRDRTAKSLRELHLADLRALARVTAWGAFRPLKSAPNLQSGWRFRGKNETELEVALNHFYPGAVADWSAARQPRPPVTHYREFTNRQSGMYRITAALDDTQAAAVARACCHKSLCLKRRLWTVPGQPPDTAQEKSMIPCLEPCAVLLELARKAARIEQEKRIDLKLSPSESRSLIEALDTALAHPGRDLREAEFDDPRNPRRLRLLREKLAPSPDQNNVKRKADRPDSN